MLFKLKSWYKRNKLEIWVCGILLVMLIILFIDAAIVTIKSGQQGVRWNRFFGGTQLTRVYHEGTSLVWPWDKMYIYNMRMQKVTARFDVLAKNGVDVSVEITFHYRPVEKHLPQLHKYIGPEYVDVVIVPQIGSHARELFSNYEPEELFSIYREQIEEKLLANVRKAIFKDNRLINPGETEQTEQYIVFENLFISSIVLPARVSEAIEEKEATKQAAMTYIHRLDMERLEAQRKKIEAGGIRDFQSTINAGISSKYLTWKGINATVELAKSPNSKVVVIGSGKDGLPLILGGDYTQAPAAQQPDPLPLTPENNQP